MPDSPSQQAELARQLMRQGLSDEAIETRTGLSPAAILDLRAKAAVEASAPSTGRRTGFPAG